ncbi:hypothetical protein LWI28_024160 [Acer negundo]|uniref:Uncharacterized protein n=1 Tax=Acer negundo TaxID=4023 RepID=A0AAD5IW90_ACENE|nr:hypothetical protein LWI28_024160 [Acer negundo]
MLRKTYNFDKIDNWRVIRNLEDQLYSALLIEKRYWCQRARVLWLRSGDWNSRFYHSKASSRKARNRIKGLLDDDGRWVDSNAGMVLVISQYFDNLFTTINPSQKDIENLLDVPLYSLKTCILLNRSESGGNIWFFVLAKCQHPPNNHMLLEKHSGDWCIR